jgi:nitrate/TMAO reductase-like tetraheme cytochrome c subunit
MRRLLVVSILVAVGLAVGVMGGCATFGGRSATPGFAGSEKCATCHQEAYQSWKETYHAKMVRPLKDGLLKDAGDSWAKDAKGNPGPTKGNVDGKPFRMEDVQLVVGSLWKQRYLVRNEATGNHQFMDKQWNRMTRVWENYGQKNDWETMCATCHATGYRLLAYDPAKPAAQKVAMSERNTGCEACHGPGARHVETQRKEDVFNPARATKEQASLVCGYCHVRKENEAFLTAQGHKREDQPHPVVGETYKAGTDDWRTWYPDKMLLPGILPNQPLSRNYPNTDLNNAFFIDDKAQRWKSHDARKHHQEYQEFIQSSHYKNNLLGCADCHSAHAVKGKPRTVARDTCQTCHGDQYDVNKIMPGLAQTAGGLFVRTHTFNKHQDRPTGLTVSGEPTYYYRK